jgi:hypothetical protein
MTPAEHDVIADLYHNDVVAQARLFWSLGDWQSIDVLATSDNLSVASDLLLYIVAAWYQLGKTEQAKCLLQQQTLNSQQKELLAKLLISGVFNSLAKAAVCNLQHATAEDFFRAALACALPDTLNSTLLNARATEQMAQLGLPRLADNILQPQYKPDTAYYLKKVSDVLTDEPVLQVALAEYYQLRQQYDQAIVHWQAASGLLNIETPQLYYDRLKEAYKSVKGFPLGTVDQESLSGDTDKHKLLTQIHKKLEPQFYFEIGVQTGKSLALAKCEAMGVDPMPLISAELGSNARVITASSDAFFAQKSSVLLTKSLDLVFIDGMHLFEYALRDFINVAQYAKPHTLIVIDDIYPGHADQAKRERCTRAWTGDVWKVKAILQQYRPDLVVLAVDAYPTGLLLITALNNDNTQLEHSAAV